MVTTHQYQSKQALLHMIHHVLEVVDPTSVCSSLYEVGCETLHSLVLLPPYILENLHSTDSHGLHINVLPVDIDQLLLLQALVIETAQQNGGYLNTTFGVVPNSTWSNVSEEHFLAWCTYYISQVDFCSSHFEFDLNVFSPLLENTTWTKYKPLLEQATISQEVTMIVCSSPEFNR